MSPLESKEIFGNWATLLLPIGPDESIDYDLLAAEVAYFGATGVNGVYSNGSAGEFYSQSEEEFDLINEVLMRGCEPFGLPFQIGVSHMSPQISLARLRRAQAYKPSGFQVILPDWFPPTMDEIHRFLQSMGEAAGPVPLIVYNPPHAKRRLSPEEWTEVVERHPAVAGIKVAGGDEHWYRAMEPVLSRVSVFIPGHTLATGLSRGARGAYSNVACLSPRGAQRWYQSCLEDPRAALDFELRLNEFFNLEVKPLISVRKLPNMAADKALAVAGGWLPGLSTRLRWPYSGAEESEAHRIGAAARIALPELFLGG